MITKNIIFDRDLWRKITNYVFYDVKLNWDLKDFSVYVILYRRHIKKSGTKSERLDDGGLDCLGFSKWTVIFEN